MYWSTALKFVSFLIVTCTPNAGAFFGLSSRRSLSPYFRATDHYYQDTRYSTNERMTRKHINEKLCDSFKIGPKQRKMCRRITGMAETLMVSVKEGTHECQRSFKHDRWNCSTGKSRTNILKRGFKETSFLYALQAAALTHFISKACSTGTIGRCSCAKSGKPEEVLHQVKYGSCGDKINYGKKFTRSFLKANLPEIQRTHKSRKTKIELHNAFIGIRAVQNNMVKRCQCHGISGSCEVKTCWMRLSNFRDTASDLKEKYEKATLLSPTNKANPPKFDRKKCKRQLVYYELSPTFCKKTKYGDGTRGRHCLQKDRDCKSLCCGRGYNTKTEKVVDKCKCRVLPTYNVVCDQCSHLIDIHICK